MTFATLPPIFEGGPGCGAAPRERADGFTSLTAVTAALRITWVKMPAPAVGLCARPTYIPRSATPVVAYLLPRPCRSCHLLGRGHHVRAREAIAQRLGLDSVDPAETIVQRGG